MQSAVMRRMTAAFAGAGMLGAATAVFAEPRELMQTICIACHNQYTLQAGLNLENFDPHQPQLDPVVAEKIIRKVNSGQMPPREMPRAISRRSPSSCTR